MKKFYFLFLCLLALSACVSREDADAKLAKGCRAGVESLMSGDFKINEIKDRTFRQSPEFGPDYREVMLSVVESDGWSSSDKNIICVFSEGFGFLNAGYTATLHQLKKDEQIYGQDGSEIRGSVEDHLKLHQAVEQGMR